MKNATDFSQASSANTPASLHIQDEAEACTAIFVACLHANELYGMTENTAFHATIRNRNIFRGHDAQTLIATAERYYEQAGGPAALIDAALGAIREQTRLPLFYQCLDVVLADGLVTPQEHKILLYLKGKFKVSDAAIEKGLEVLLAKNQL